MVVEAIDHIYIYQTCLGIALMAILGKPNVVDFFSSPGGDTGMPVGNYIATQFLVS